MSLPLTDLISLLRVMLDDNDPDFQEYSDEDLIICLRIGVMQLNATWSDNGYVLELNQEDLNNKFYQITPYPPDSMQILYLWKTLIGMTTWKNDGYNSYDNGVMRLTARSRKDDLLALKELFDEALEEQRYNSGNSSVGCVSNTLNDYFNDLTGCFGANWWINGICYNHCGC